MILKDIYLYPELTEYDVAVTSKFKEQTRSLCNFLGRYIKSAKVKCEKYNRVCIVCRETPSLVSYINSSGVLRVEVFFDVKEYLNKKFDDLNEYFIGLVIDGVNKCDDISLPKEMIIKGIDLFRAEGYKNEWVFKSKSFNRHGLKVILKCSLTMNDFFLDLYVMKNKNVIFYENVKKDYPEEVVFGYHLKDLIVQDDGDVEVIDRLGRVIYKKNISYLVV